MAGLLLTGTVQAALHLADWRAVFATEYGLLVLAKAGGALLLLSFAAFNHLRFTPALATRGTAALSRSIRAEIAVAALVLGVTAVLSVTPPHLIAQAATDRGHAHAHGPTALPGTVVATQDGGLSLTPEVTPARAGPNHLTLHLARLDQEPFVSSEVWLDLSQQDAGVAGLRRMMRGDSAGRYAHEGPELAIPGRWTARIGVLINDFEQFTGSLDFDVIS